MGRTVSSVLLLCLFAGALAGVAQAETLQDLQARFTQEKDKPYATRFATVQAIAALRSEPAARFLFDVIRNDADLTLRLNTIHEVAKIPFPSVFDELVRVFRYGDKELHSTAFYAIVTNREETLPDPVIDEVLASTDQGIRTNALRYLARHGDARFDDAAEKFALQFPGSTSSLVPVLVSAATPGAARLLLRIYDDDRVAERNQAGEFFAKAMPAIRAVLVEALKGTDRAMKVRAAVLAGRGAVTEAEPALAAAVGGADPELRAILVESIGAVGAKTDAGRRAVLDALGAKETAVAEAGIRATRSAPQRDAIPLLIALVGSGSRLLAAEAAVSLEQLTGQQYGSRADLWKRWWAAYGSTFDPASVASHAPTGLSQVLVDLAIEKGAAALAGSRGAKAPWDYGHHPLGTTALVVLALHAAGRTARDPAVKAGVDYILAADPPSRTYDAGLVAMALEAVGGRRYRRRIADCAKQLLDTERPEGLWGYPSGNGDNSNTQYAVLGLRAAARAGVRVPQRTWRSIREHFLSARGPDGGWTYPIKGNPSTSSMTAAGVTCLLICLENLKIGDAEVEELQGAIDKGYEALGTLMKLDKDTLYALYGIERAGVLGGRATMADHPWYAPGALRLLDEQGRDGFWTGNYSQAVETAFAILFLKRATVPIAVSTK